MSLLWCFLHLLPLVPEGPAAASFERDFTGETMRVDYHHWGNATSEEAAIDRLLTEGAWPGSRTHLTDQPDYGKYRVVVRDAESGRLLFAQGYSTLFGEWQTTSEAAQATRVFHETVRFPQPRLPFLLQLWSRSRSGELVAILERRYEGAGEAIIARRAPMAGVEPNLLNEGGPAATSLDLVIIADGYPAAQREKALRDGRRFAAVVLEAPPFDRYRARISVRLVFAPAAGIGPDEPRKGYYADPPAATTFNTFGSARYLTSADNRRLRDLAGTVPYDSIIVMVNSSRYGGAGVYNTFSIFASDNEWDSYLLLHEFGHGFAGLGDEYYSSSVAYSDFYPAGVEPWEPNVTALLAGPEQVKWRSLLTPGTALPTPPTAEHAHCVGIFEGAGYSAKGLYRPALDCRMFSKGDLDWCPVCMAAVEQMITFYTE